MTGVQHVPQIPSCPYQASLLTIINIIIIIIIIIIAVIIVIITIIIIISKFSRDQTTKESQVLVVYECELRSSLASATNCVNLPSRYSFLYIKI